ncbi:MAG: M2 family metallopeptidase [Bacteroidales bacterium]|nr:M2 family metallopeptidase [Bacteroidales bacterium]MDZ4204477.1 M2 family metallopeptidase [Bacteroidales bacterium]
MRTPRFTALVMMALAMLSMLYSCQPKSKKMEKELFDFIARYETSVKPIYTESNLAYWNASISGKAEDWARAEEGQVKLTELHASKENFALLKKIKESGAVTDALLLRQLNTLYNSYLSSQADIEKLKEKIKLETEVEQKYSNFRAEVRGKMIPDNEVEEILKTSTDNALLQEAWFAHKNIGPLVSDDVKRLAKLRNEIASELGFSNYHQMSLTLSDQNPVDVHLLFDELDLLTRDAFAQLKDDIDTHLSKRYTVEKHELMPWHYQNRFFQEAPRIYTVDFDKYYANQNIEKLTRDFYHGIGLDIDDVLAKSDMYEKSGKNQHAYCIHIDREGDVRVLCNLRSNYNWMNTNLHEFGHAVYDKYLDPVLPFVLKDPAHPFTTEAIAMIFGRFASNPLWMCDMGIITHTEMEKIARESFNSLRLEQLVFSRWSQVMYRFEKGMYENPDQDLNALWWNLAETYQLLHKPIGRNEPDWAAKIHVALYPCYYHNYHLGELLASQLFYHITTSVLGSGDFSNQSFVNQPEVGDYLKTNVFMPGSRWYWNDMIEKAIGEKLTAKYYAMQFVE